MLMVQRQLVLNPWLLPSLQVYHYKKTTEHSYYITQLQVNMKHKQQGLVHTLMVWQNIVKDGVTAILKHPMMHLFKSFLCLLLDLVTISSAIVVVTYLSLIVTVTSGIPLSDLLDLSQQVSPKTRQDKLRTLYLLKD